MGAFINIMVILTVLIGIVPRTCSQVLPTNLVEHADAWPAICQLYIKGNNEGEIVQAKLDCTDGPIFIGVNDTLLGALRSNVEVVPAARVVSANTAESSEHGCLIIFCCGTNVILHRPVMEGVRFGYAALCASGNSSVEVVGGSFVDNEYLGDFHGKTVITIRDSAFTNGGAIRVAGHATAFFLNSSFANYAEYLDLYEYVLTLEDNSEATLVNATFVNNSWPCVVGIFNVGITVIDSAFLMNKRLPLEAVGNCSWPGGTHVVVKNSNFTENNHTTSIDLPHGCISANISGIAVQNNTGGAVHLGNDRLGADKIAVLVTNSVFVNNTGCEDTDEWCDSGGGLSMYGDDSGRQVLTMSNTTSINNTSGLRDRSEYRYGGGLFAVGWSCSVTNSEFIQSTAFHNGMGLLKVSNSSFTNSGVTMSHGELVSNTFDGDSGICLVQGPGTDYYGDVECISCPTCGVPRACLYDGGMVDVVMPNGTSYGVHTKTDGDLCQVSTQSLWRVLAMYGAYICLLMGISVACAIKHSQQRLAGSEHRSNLSMLCQKVDEWLHSRIGMFLGGFVRAGLMLYDITTDILLAIALYGFYATTMLWWIFIIVIVVPHGIASLILHINLIKAQRALAQCSCLGGHRSYMAPFAFPCCGCEWAWGLTLGLIVPWAALTVPMDIPIMLLHSITHGRRFPWLNLENYGNLHSFLAACIESTFSVVVVNQSKRKTSNANGQTNLGHKHKAPDHNHEATQPMVDLPHTS